jgi:NTE family protein
MSVPDVFSFVEIDGKPLVDGGVSNNVPVGVVRDMGADVLIVVNVGTPLMEREEITSALGVAGQLTRILTAKNIEAQLDTLTDEDTLIVPDLGDITSASFDRSADAVAAGLAAANRKRTKLGRLSLSEADYAAYLSRERAPRPGPPVIHFVKIENQSRLGDDVIRAYLTVNVGEPLDVEALEADIGQIYGLELFENVWYEIVEEEGQTGLVVCTRERSWGPNYLQFGMTSANDFDGDSSFNVSISYLRTAINSLGGEWRSILQIGEEPFFYTELYQPLDIHTRYFFAPRLLVGRENFNLYESGDRIAEYRVTRYGIEISGGRQFGTWGEGRIGYRRQAGDVEVQVGPAFLSDIDFDAGEAFLRLSLDELDNVNFPRSGAYATLEWTASREDLGADTSFDQVLFNSIGARSWGRHTLAGGIRFNTTLDSDAPIQSRFRTGGFLSLSGFNPDELSGQHEGLFRLIYYRRIGDFNLMPTFLGVSFEVGNVWEDEDDIKLDNTLVAGSVFLGVDTVLGPIYLGYGQAEHGNGSAYFYLGRVF